MTRMQSLRISQRRQMECKGIFDSSWSHRRLMFLKQVSMGFLPIGGSAALFPDQSASYPRRIAQITGRDIQAYPEGDQQRERGARVSTFAVSRGGQSSTPGRGARGSSRV